MSEHKFPLAEWKGSERTYDHVRQQIAERWGEEAAKKYNPLGNCFTVSVWNSRGYLINNGEKAIQSYTFVEKKVKDENGEEKTISVKHTVNLFFINQVHRIEP